MRRCLLQCSRPRRLAAGPLEAAGCILRRPAVGEVVAQQFGIPRDMFGEALFEKLRHLEMKRHAVALQEGLASGVLDKCVRNSYLRPSGEVWLEMIPQPSTSESIGNGVSRGTRYALNQLLREASTDDGCDLCHLQGPA